MLPAPRTPQSDDLLNARPLSAEAHLDADGGRSDQHQHGGVLMERLMRSFQLLSSDHGRLQVLELLVNLVPHYVGPTLPGGFFIGLSVVVNGLSKSSRSTPSWPAACPWAASPRRSSAPGRRAYGVQRAALRLRAALQSIRRSRRAARRREGGWNGDVRPRALLSTGPFFLTADRADAGGRHLERVFIRKIGSDGREDVLTAASAVVNKDAGDRSVRLDLHDGRQVSTIPRPGDLYRSTSRADLDVPGLSLSGKLFGSAATTSATTPIELAQQGFAKVTVCPGRRCSPSSMPGRPGPWSCPLPLLAVLFGPQRQARGLGLRHGHGRLCCSSSRPR
ncbi:hypothetical protein ACRAWD_26490 [Caulobacter segnis]